MPSVTICCISQGTPGTAYTTLPSSAPVSGQMSPGAVPGIAGLSVAPTGTSAWRRLLSGIGRPRPPNIARIRSTSASSRTSSTPITSAMALRVMSSWVGPSPPQTMTASLRSSARRSTSTMRSRLSPTFVW